MRSQRDRAHEVFQKKLLTNPFQSVRLTSLPQSTRRACRATSENPVMRLRCHAPVCWPECLLAANAETLNFRRCQSHVCSSEAPLTGLTCPVQGSQGRFFFAGMRDFLPPRTVALRNLLSILIVSLRAYGANSGSVAKRLVNPCESPSHLRCGSGPTAYPSVFYEKVFSL